VLERVPESGAVVLGVRPEHLRTSAATGAQPDSDGFDATVELAEALGHEQLLHLRVDGVPLTVRGAPGVRPAVGSLVRVHVDASHVHLFDAATGVSLRRAG
jgi:multiple sugar transport system ATP-binding protein